MTTTHDGRATADPSADPSEPSDVGVRDAPDGSRYELVVDGAVVGRAGYARRGDLLVVPHVEVDPARRGHGLAARLMEGLVADVRERGLRVDPRCPYAAAWFRRHPEHADLLDRS